MARKNHPSKPAPQQTAANCITTLHLAPTEWGVCSGYGRAAFSIARALTELGVKVGVVSRPKLAGDGPEIPTLEDSPTAVLHIGAPPDYKLVRGARNVALCWWPFSKLPTEWYGSLIGIESIIVPTRYCEDGAILPQPNQKTHIVPLGLDRETFQPFERKRADKLRLMFFDTHADAYDAGGDIAITAFIRAFPEKRDDVSLDIWSTQRERLEAPDMRIQLRRHIGSDGDLVRLYRRYDALLATQRGTGFGLIATEAMATGMPVFHSGQGGFASIADLGVLTGAHKRSTVKAAHDSAECFEPLADVVATRLRQIDTDYEAFQAKALQDAEIVRERFTWEKTARAILEALR